MKSPRRRAGFSHQELDELRLALSLAVLREHNLCEIRAKILENLERWKGQGCWGHAYEEWSELARNKDDDALRAAMSGRHEDAVRLRQSTPAVGLLSQEKVREFWEAASRGTLTAGTT